jgi:hypothetical protein
MFEFPARLTGARYAQFIGTELPNLLEIVPLAYRINDWFQHDGVLAETFGKFWITNIHSAGSVEEDRIIGLPGLQI